MRPSASCLAVATLGALLITGAAAEPACTGLQYRQGAACASPTSSGAVAGDRVDVRAEVRRDGTPGGWRASGSGGGLSVDGVEFVYRNANDCGSTDALAAEELCRNDFTVTLDGTDIPWQPITMLDIASFRPTPPAVSAEPDGWAVVGLPTNFVANASQQVVPGVLLGEQAEVRFTPVGFAWDHGDGTTRTLSTAGASWADLGLDQFAATATTHVYGERGTVMVRLTVTYSAEYRFLGPGWTPVLGELTVSTAPAPFRVVSAATMLVDGECGDGPGC